MDSILFKETNETLEDKKKFKESGGNNLNWKKFTLNFFGHFLITICFFTVVIGACGLYTAKVAQSNILPTNAEFAPYTSTDYWMEKEEGGGTNESAQVLMNIVKGRTWKGFNFFDEPVSINAQKATFIKEDFNDNGVFSFFCKMKPFSETNENFARLAFYLRNLFINGIVSSFGMVNSIYSLLYALPEWFLMLIYFTSLPIIVTFLFLWNFFQTFINALSYIIKLPFRVNNPEPNKDRNHAGINFKHVATEQEDPMSQWWRKWTQCESDEYSKKHTGIWGTITEFMDYIGYGVMFMIYFMVTIYAFIPIVLFSTIFALFNPLMRKYKLDGETKDKENGLGDFIRDTFVYKKTFITFLAAYNLLMSTGVYLSKGYTFSCFIGLLILAFYFEVFSIPDAEKINTEDSTQIIIDKIASSIEKPLSQVSKGANTFELCKDKVAATVEKVAATVEKVAATGTGTKQNTKYIPGTNTAINPNVQQNPFSTKHILQTKNPKLEKEKTILAVKPETTVMNPLQQEPAIQTAGSKLKRNKNGNLHKKYNFSLI